MTHDAAGAGDGQVRGWGRERPVSSRDQWSLPPFCQSNIEYLLIFMRLDNQ
ncbi:hypothetical protein HrrHm1_110 [Halorubrum virus Humcor1]|nr:hypothetical protein HrrHm1_110 [Halorubrum virus Humcor1]